MRMIKKHSKIESTENPFWITYSDLLSSIVMIFLILIFAFMGLSTLQIKLQKKQFEESNKQVAQIKELEQKVIRLKIDKHAEALSDLKNRLGRLKNKYPKEIEIDKNRGTASIKNKILFDTGSSELRPEGKVFLNRFMKDWSNDFLIDQFVGEDGIIEQIVFEGHSDPSGAEDINENYRQNMTLSLSRSETVTNFIFSKDCEFPRKQKLKEKISASGRSNIESILALMKQKPGHTPSDWNKADMPLYRSVNLKLLFVNPLLKWESDEAVKSVNKKV